MKPRSLDEIEAMLASEEFRTWWGDLKTIRSELHEAEQLEEELLDKAFHLELDSERDQKKAIDTMEESSDEEAEVSMVEAEVTEIENRALEKVGTFEDQRFRASDAWVRLGAVEKRLEETREKLEAAKKKKDAAVGRLESELNRFSREHRSVHETYERDIEKRARLWREVESLWDESLKLSLLAAERGCIAIRRKREAERLLRSSDKKQEEARQLREAVEEQAARVEKLRERLSGLLMIAHEQFGAIAGRGFLYFPSKGQEKEVWCISLQADADTYNIETDELSIYRATARDGVARIEPLGPESDASGGEDRVEAWFRGHIDSPPVARGAGATTSERAGAEEKTPETAGDSDAEKAAGG